ncbi:MAG TPA: GNAT family N-acetyltransferase [Pyrinomonadaceae bacterium]|nr:GNAT family N-acetyltransferase [Pyrinomonadaceae bacterium]
MCEIETEHVQLRMFRPDDLDELSRIFADPDVVRHIGTGQPAVLEETEYALQSIIRHWDRHEFGRWAAVYKPTQKLIGYCGLRSFNDLPELVYLLSKEYWGKGLATEMARAALSYGFEEKQFERIIAMTKLDNHASERVMRKLGMCYERNATICGMKVVCYSLSRDKYLSDSSNHIFRLDNSRGDRELVMMNAE